MDFDYIIVGSGAAGSVLAGRLSADPRNRVLLLEYGGGDWNPMLYIPKGFFFTLRGDRYTYKYPTRPVGLGGQPGRPEFWTRGKVLGGSTAVNGMMWLRGAQADFDALEARGNPGWGWERVLSVYRAMEDHNLGASPMRGEGGPYGVSIVENDDDVIEPIFDAATQLGWERVADVNASDIERIGFTPASIKKGRRSSAYSAFVRPYRKRSNLTVQTRTRVGRLVFDGRRVVGVQARHRGRLTEFRARKEVIVCASTFETTALLERSGIGNPEILRAAGVPVRVESPQLGERVIEQRCVSAQARFKDRIGPTQDLNSLYKQGWEGVKYLATRTGPISTPGYDLVCQFKSSPEVDRPDVQGIIVPMALDTSSKSLKLAQHSGIAFMGYQIRPTTTGSVHLSGADPDDMPVIHARILEDEVDKQVTAPILDHARRLFDTSPLRDLIAEEEYPGPTVSTRDEVLRYALDTGVGIFHAVGAAAMGPNDDDVVDPQLRVRGVEGLRVADASVLPMQLSGNTAAPCMVVGWIAADLIRADNS